MPADMMDPNVVKRGIEDIKEHMKDMQREAIMIENDMEKRFHQMNQRTQHQRHLPQSLTEEFDSFHQQMKEKDLHT